MDKLIEEYNTIKDSDVELSDFGVRVASDLYTLGTQVADAELEEKEVMVKLLKGEEKTTVALAEAQAVVSTENKYGKLKKELESAYEVLNMIKLRIRTLTAERELSKGVS